MDRKVKPSSRGSWTASHKKCTRCKETKTLSEFYIRGGTNRFAGTPSPRCRACNVVANRESWAKNGSRGINWERRIKYVFGMTREDYDHLLASQGGSCAICQTKSPIGRRYKNGRIEKFSIDHCHRTGRIRGLLCMKCNMSIGQFDDSLPLLQKAMEYLRQHGSTWL